MSGKTRIIEVLGEAGLRLPALVNAALAANDRAKYFFMLLQLAGAHASAPHELHDSARGERLAADVADASLDAVVAGSSLEDGRLRIPRVAHLCRQLCEAVENMLEPLAASRDPQYDSYAARYAGLREQAATEDDEHIAPAAIAAMASGDRQHGDSLHLLVMDLHKALNALQARIAEEHIDGASCYQIDDADRPLIAAFMRGINRTRGLKFDHPGLDTTATRSGARLVLQNDIGTTDAHVLVVHVEAMRVSITYTDVHLQRLLFFQ
ncbi:MAG: hypothetical protein HGA47_08105, partial [Zoogloea sp.]|nr:hypothetical protein [Zoogloea sp.]